SVVVLDAPDLAPLLGDRPRIPADPKVAAKLADLLALEPATEAYPGVPAGPGAERPVPGEVRELLPGAPATYREHDDLVVDGVEVDWRYVGGQVHAATVEGLARGLAWAADRWDRRFEVLVLLTDPDRADDLRAEREFDPRLAE